MDELPVLLLLAPPLLLCLLLLLLLLYRPLPPGPERVPSLRVATVVFSAVGKAPMACVLEENSKGFYNKRKKKKDRFNKSHFLA